MTQTARERGEWAVVAQEQIADPYFPDIVPYDSTLDDVSEDVECGCAGYLPDFHDPERDEPLPETDD